MLKILHFYQLLGTNQLHEQLLNIIDYQIYMQINMLDVLY